MRQVPRVLLLLESSRASGRSLLRGISNYARHHGSWAFYWQPHGLEEGWPRLHTLDAQGVILRDVDKVREVRARNLPAIVVEHSKSAMAGLINVVTDSAAVGRLASRTIQPSTIVLKHAPMSVRSFTDRRQLNRAGR